MVYQSTGWVLSLNDSYFSSSKKCFFSLVILFYEIIDFFHDSNEDHLILIDFLTSSKLYLSSLITLSVFLSYPSLIGEDYKEIGLEDGLLFLSNDFYFAICYSFPS